MPIKSGVTVEQKAMILKLFLRTKLRPGEEIIDNTSYTIADEVGVTHSQVNECVSHYINILKKRVDNYDKI